jgi:hypothetical protein
MRRRGERTTIISGGRERKRDRFVSWSRRYTRLKQNKIK